MRITIDTDKGIFIVPNTFDNTIAKENATLKRAGITDREITKKAFIEKAIEEAFKNPILTQEEAKSYDHTFASKIAK